MKIVLWQRFSANFGPEAEMAVGVTEYCRYFRLFISKIGFVEEKLWFAVNFMKFTKIRNSTENLEFHDFHEIQHKNDDLSAGTINCFHKHVGLTNVHN